VATAANGYTSTKLPDGSVLELNASSEITIHFTAAERRLHLVRGEAHFTVAKNRARPFWVEAGTVAVRAVGTEFNVSLRPDNVDVLVTEGRVQVERGSPLAAGQPLQTVAVVSAGQETVVALQGGPDRPAVATVSAAAIREELAWQGPRLEFADTPLAEVVSQFNRYNAVQVELSDPVLGAQPVGGSFKAENVDAFVRLLTSGKDVVADRPDAGHIVLRRIH
jgi:transmembrane sensor